jgi:uncharacterized membrane protein
MRLMRDITEGLLWVAVCYFVGWLAYPHLPEEVPIHFNVKWQPDGWVHRETFLWLMPSMLALLWLILTVCFWLAATEKGQLRLEQTDLKLLLSLRTLIGAFTLSIHGSILAVGLGWLSSPRTTILPSIGVLFIFIGSVLPKLKRNWVAGVRLPWTLVNDGAWKSANRFCGYGFMVIGLLFALAPLLPYRFDLIPFGLLLALILGVVVQSYLVYRRSSTSSL